MTIQRIILQRSNIPQRIIRFCVSSQPYGIYDRNSQIAGQLMRLAAIVAFDLEKPGDLAHTYSAACIEAIFSFAISASARRYSTGITLRNSRW